jgi:hypothetical protein
MPLVRWNMPLGFRSLRRGFLLCLLSVAFAVGSLCPALAQAPDLPPRPTPQKLRGLSPGQQSGALRLNYEAENTWYASLSPEQKAALAKQRPEAPKQRDRNFPREIEMPDPLKGYTWQVAAREVGLSADEIAQLGRDKILIEDFQYRQVFGVYDAMLSGNRQHASYPLFLTSDSLLNAFHVLFEDSFREWELRRAERLRPALESVLTQTRENIRLGSYPPAELADGWRHAQLVTGPALRLLGTPLEFFDRDCQQEIERQVGKIRAAEKVELPDWLGPVTGDLLALDYRRCRPVGFYADDPRLVDYFRAVRWLQMVPFRPERDSELTAIALLGYGLMERRDWSLQEFFNSDWFVADDATLSDGQFEFQNLLKVNRGEWNTILAKMRTWLERMPPGRLSQRINADLRVTSGERPLAKLEEIRFRILPAYRLPESVLFQQIGSGDRMPSALEVAAMLGSGFARRQDRGIATEKLDAALKSIGAEWTPVAPSVVRDSWYNDYLRVLSHLFDAPDPDAPAFMAREAWAAKSCQTVLASWVQARHTFTLQVKQSASTLGLSPIPPGFVEPNPVFFGQLADLAARAQEILRQDGVFGSRKPAPPAEVTSPDGESVKEPFADQLDERWQDFERTARRLEAMVHKQLRRQPWNEEEKQFIHGYGGHLAFAMGTTGSPHDTAPRWAEVHRDPQKDRAVAVGIGRPRLLHVLYPWNGTEILCRGAVLPFYEYHAQARLTDPEWQRLLDSPQAPAMPEWIAPYIAR